jgi:hypothetical protein
MIVTLAWKEFREHWPIWLTMVIMTGVMGFGVAELAARDAMSSRTAIQTLTILGMAATYGVVCGAMMLAGERESGTLVFLDIFHGRRELIWCLKVIIGAVFAFSEALAVALMLYLFKEVPPQWTLAIIGEGGRPVQALDAGGIPTAITSQFWFSLLPVVTLEAYAWGLLGSAPSRRVVSGAGIAALLAAPVWLFTVFMPPPIFLGVRLVAAGIVLVVSLIIFLNQSREVPSGPPPRPDQDMDRRRVQRRRVDGRRGDSWNGGFDGERRRPRRREERPTLDVAPFVPQPRIESVPMVRLAPRVPQAHSPTEVLWWLTFRQAWALISILAIAGVLIGFLVPSYGQLLWPIATLFLGVACGTAAFASEQRDLSYQFLSAQHLPLNTIWRVKIFFWLAAAALLAGFMFAGGLVVIVQQNLPALRLGIDPPAGFHFGTLHELMGSVLFFSIWLVYGFCMGQLFVLFCRKNVLAVLLASIFAFAAIGLWLPALLCGGLSGWQLWLPPLVLLAATRFLIRAWAGGRIKERRPLTATIGFAAAALVWSFATFGVRAWELPEVPEPLDRDDFRAAMLEARDARQIQDALAEVERKEAAAWLPQMVEAAQLPPGVLEPPSATGQAPTLRLLPPCRTMTEKLTELARSKQAQGQPGPALEHLTQLLALSRTMRCKAPPGFYLAGVEVETRTLDELDTSILQGKPAANLLRRVLDELNRHAAETPPPLDCLETECFRAEGALNNAAGWSFYSGSRRIRERWLAGWIALSLEAPWEEQRAVRLWRAVWGGLFRAVKTPHWELPQTSTPITSDNETTRDILRGWLPPAAGAGTSITAQELARLLDHSWMSDERLFTAVVPLRMAATRAQWRVDAHRLAVALQLYQIQEGKTAQHLKTLVPKYLSDVPTDPYSGELFRYRISGGEEVTLIEQRGGRPWQIAHVVSPGQAILWSSGPDRTDNGARKHADLPDDDAGWGREGYDLITIVPRLR